jgi:hypothetical protein
MFTPACGLTALFDMAGCKRPITDRQSLSITRSLASPSAALTRRGLLFADAFSIHPAIPRESAAISQGVTFRTPDRISSAYHRERDQR